MNTYKAIKWIHVHQVTSPLPYHRNIFFFKNKLHKRNCHCETKNMMLQKYKFKHKTAAHINYRVFFSNVTFYIGGFVFFNVLVSVTAGGPRSPRGHM